MPTIPACLRSTWFVLWLLATASTGVVAGAAGGHGQVGAAQATTATGSPSGVDKGSAKQINLERFAPTLAATADDSEKAAGTPPVVDGEAAPAAPSLLVDPMEHLRQRLAEKLAARRAQVGARGDELQVIAKSPAPADASASAAAALLATRTLAPKTLTVLTTPVRHLDAAVRDAPIARGTVGSKRPARSPHPGLSRHPVDWSYAGSGEPGAWAAVDPAYAACSAGKRQSPIDIGGGIRVDLEPVRFDYRPGGFSVLDTGHTVQVNPAAGNAIEVLGRRYELVEFHFHRPAETLVEGKRFEMEVQLTHKDAHGRLAVVAVLFEQGAPQPVVQAVWNNLPLEAHDDLPARALLDPAGLLPTGRGYLTYLGSLTAPPCTEGVLWMVMQQPGTMSREQLAIFEHLYPMNARPVQPLAGRLIKISN